MQFKSFPYVSWLLASLSIASAHAATLVDWNLTGIDHPYYSGGPTDARFTGVPASHAEVDEALTISALHSQSRGAFTGLNWTTANAARGELNLLPWDFVGTSTATTTLGDGIPDNWLQFSVEAKPGVTFTVDSISVSAWRNGNGAPSVWRFQYSLDNGESWTDFAPVQTESSVGLVSGAPVFREKTFTGSITAGALLIRFAPTGNGTTNSGGTGNLHINALRLSGSTTGTAIPPEKLPGAVTLSPAGGILRGPTEITLATSPANDIRYTLDGSEPTAESLLYTEPLPLGGSAVLKARAFLGSHSGPLAQAHYVQIPAARPNILLILGQATGFGDLSSFGSVSIQTPHLDVLTHKGVRFTQATTTGGGHTSSLYALLHGRIGSRSTLPAQLAPHAAGIAAQEWTLGEALRKSGYRTGFIGTWSLGAAEQSHPVRQGFQQFYGQLWNDTTLLNSAPLQDNAQVVTAAPFGRQLLDLLSTQAEGFIAASSSEAPFFLVFSAPHFATAGDSVLGAHGNRIEAFDAAVGRLIAKLEAENLAANTLIVFTSATTAARSEAGPSLGSNALFRDGDGSTWEGGVRVPAIARWDGVIPAAKNSFATLWLPDIFATLADIAQGWVPADRAYDGISLPHVLLGTETAPTDTIALYLHDPVSGQLQAVRQGAWKLHLATNSTDAEAPASGTPPLLYNVNIDPSERINLLSAQPEIASALQETAAAHRQSLTPGLVQLPAPQPPFLSQPRGSIGSGGGTLALEFQRPPATLNDSYYAEYSADLQSWHPLPLQTQDFSVSTNTDGSETVRLNFSAQSVLQTESKIFIRIGSHE